MSATLAAPAHGTSPQADLAAKKAQAERLQAQIEANYTQADILDEQLVQAQTAVDTAQRKIGEAERAIKKAEADAARLRVLLGGRAARLYMGAGNNDPLDISATDVRELGSRAKYSEAAAEQDTRMLDQLRVAEEQLGIQRKELGKQKSEAQTRQKAADAARRELARTTGQQEKLLRSVKGEMATLVRQIQVQRQQAAEAAARAAAAQAAAAQRAAAAAQRAASTNTNNNGGGGGGGGTPGGGDNGVDPGNIPAPSPGAAAAVAYARAQIGKPYQYAGTGPGSFDCSGLVMMAWAQGGVSMSHGSQSQYLSFPHVPISQLQPGDIVFFGSSGPSNHHDGLYIGGGTMIEAPHTGAFVRYSTIYRHDLVQVGSRP